MIIGNGLIAKSVRGKINDDELIIFASGVSNSKEQNDEEYKRELSLLEKIILENPNKKLIYFSSCSVVSSNNVKYNRHKLNVESFIRNSTKNYIILRLPNIVGLPSKNNQLINYFYYSLVNDDEMSINVNYIRHLIDVDDLSLIVDKLKNENEVTLNVAFNNGIKVGELLTIIEEIVGKEFKNIDIVNDKNDYVIDNGQFLKLIINSEDFNTNPKNIIKKYYTKNEN